MELVPELRERIYKFALASNQAINPHLCDTTLQFHDDNQPHHHGAIDALLGVTRVSKQIRRESLPMFYSVNTFAVGKDTSTYFDRLEHLGRFHMIRHVRFEIDMRRESSAAMTLRNMHQFIKEAEAYENELSGQEVKNTLVQTVGLETSASIDGKTMAHTNTGTDAVAVGNVVENMDSRSRMGEVDKSDSLPNTDQPTHTTLVTAKQSTAARVGESFTSLTTHPQYSTGGVSELSAFIALRKLTSTIRSPTGAFTTQLVLPVPRADIFTQWESLKWFPAVCYGLGIDLHLVEGVPFDCVDQGFVTLTWHQKYQKKDFVSARVHAVSDGTTAATAHVDVYSRAVQLFPLLETMPRPRVNTYYRYGCDGELRAWYSVHTEGGGIQ